MSLMVHEGIVHREGEDRAVMRERRGRRGKSVLENMVGICVRRLRLK